MKKALTFFTLACLMLMPLMAQAQEWSPKHPVKLQIGFGAGGSTDIMGRLIAAKIEENTGWNVVVENKPGGGGIAMLSTLMRQKPDGQTIGLGVNMPVLLNLAHRGDKLPFKIDSFDYIGTILRGEIAMVARSDAPFNNLEELLSFAAESKDGITVAFDAKPQQMVMEPVAEQAGVKFKFVTHKSGAEQIQSVLGGHTTIALPAGGHIKYVKSGDLKMIASLSKDRHSYAPDAKTLIESGYNFSLEPYFYIAAPKGLPTEIKDALAKALDDAVNSDSVKEALFNTLTATARNLGPEGTLEMLQQGEIDILALVNKDKEKE
ncbi:tripartite tricarboxylate transporter substrate binding protein [Desulfosediminicola ganghwensis]|uniref:tripartite tricarboxylate transporter substrate binding protein n=1 Tax=Desulfosediminicola ganghwensis TaxID=2569540 RepID=UPI0010AB684C|nr:tripartite tricarboxylate transporter substrate binding protein [Desulfosediminicola ganghwensis]